jgi:hypothetical protein
MPLVVTCRSRGSEAPSIVGEDRQFEQEMRATWRVCRDRQMAVKLPYQPRDDPKSKARPGLVDVEALGKADAAVGDFNVKAPFDFESGIFNHPGAIRISVFHSVGDELVDQKTQRNGMVGGEQHRICTAIQDVRPPPRPAVFCKIHS